MGSYGERESILEQFGQCQHVGIPALPPVGIRHDRRRYPPCRYLLDVVAIGIGSFQFPCGIDHDSKNPLRELIDDVGGNEATFDPQRICNEAQGCSFSAVLSPHGCAAHNRLNEQFEVVLKQVDLSALRLLQCHVAVHVSSQCEDD